MDENKIQQNNDRIKSLRTYTSDMADAVRTDEVSVIKIALAEKEKREREGVSVEKEETNNSKIFLMIGGIILIIGAIFVFYFLSQNKKEDVAPTIKKDIETFISYDSKSIIDATNVTDARELASTIDKEVGVDSQLIRAIFLNKKTDTGVTQLSSKDFISIIGSNMPDALIRSLSKNYLLGKYSENNNSNGDTKTNTFLIFETTDYNQAYASMLVWEPNILRDLSTLFGIKISDNSIFEKPWNDIVIDNKDARVLSDENGNKILYYIFVNKNDFIITDNIDAIKEIINRLNIKNTRSL